MKLKPTHFYDPEPVITSGSSTPGAHSEALQYYEENRIRYEGFKLEKDEEGYLKYVCHLPGYLENDWLIVRFFGGGITQAKCTKEDSYFLIESINGLSVSLFESICSENRIDLNILES